MCRNAPRSRPPYARTRTRPHLSSDSSFIKNFSSFFFRFGLVWSGLIWNNELQVLEENKKQGEEDQAFEKRVESKKAAAKKRATRRSACFSSLSPFTIS